MSPKCQRTTGDVGHRFKILCIISDHVTVPYVTGNPVTLASWHSNGISISRHSGKMIHGDIAIRTRSMFAHKCSASFLFHYAGYKSKADFISGTRTIGKYNCDWSSGFPSKC